MGKLNKTSNLCIVSSSVEHTASARSSDFNVAAVTTMERAVVK